MGGRLALIGLRPFVDVDMTPRWRLSFVDDHGWNPDDFRQAVSLAVPLPAQVPAAQMC